MDTVTFVVPFDLFSLVLCTMLIIFLVNHADAWRPHSSSLLRVSHFPNFIIFQLEVLSKSGIRCAKYLAASNSDWPSRHLS